MRQSIIIVLAVAISLVALYLVIDFTSAPMKEEIKQKEMMGEPVFCHEPYSRYYYDDISCKYQRS